MRPKRRKKRELKRKPLWRKRIGLRKRLLSSRKRVLLITGHKRALPGCANSNVRARKHMSHGRRHSAQRRIANVRFNSLEPGT